MNEKIKLIINLDRGVLKAFVILASKEEESIKLCELIDKADAIDTINNSKLKEVLNDEHFVALINLLAVAVLAEENGLE